jgi:MFS family permease
VNAGEDQWVTNYPTAYPPAARAWSVVFILFLAGAISAIDRSILDLVVDPVRRDLAITDVQISLLQGFSFSLFYATVGLPLGLIADRIHRVRLLTLAIATWSLATLVGGLAPNYGWLFVSRIFVGFGEAALGPCALSLICDLFPPERRGRPLSVHMVGGAIGSGFGILMVGIIAAQTLRGAFHFLPEALGTSAWRMAFVIAGALGFGVVALLLTQREPLRRGISVTTGRQQAVLDSGRFFVANWRVFLPFYAAYGALALASWGAKAWTPAMLVRHFGMTLESVGRTLGITTLVVAATGTLIAGQIIDGGIARQGARGKLAMLAILALCGVPSVFAVFAPDGIRAILLVTVLGLALSAGTTAVLSALADLVPNEMRAVSVSILGLCSTLLGLTLGPFLIANVTEHGFRDPQMVGYSIMLVAGPALLCASALYVVTRRAASSDSSVRS